VPVHEVYKESPVLPVLQVHEVSTVQKVNAELPVKTVEPVPMVNQDSVKPVNEVIQVCQLNQSTFPQLHSPNH